MIVPRSAINVEEVVGHYEELDVFYRETWGEHVHHGLWRDRRETPEQAVRALVEHVADLGRIEPGDAVCDIGSGYGATARKLVAQHGARVTALTVTPLQHRFASMVEPGGDNPVYLLRDWLDSGLDSASFDAAIAIESLCHMGDKQRALGEAARVLRPGGRLVLCVWLAKDDAGRWASRYLLEPICREGRLAGLATETDYRELLKATGFQLDRFDDVSRNVRQTWVVCVARVLNAIRRDLRYRRFLLDSEKRHREFLRATLRILMAYHVGAMRYGIFAAHRA
jgi:tocopherol O-methyltransferase